MAVQEGTIRILLACGIGASTGFMAANMRKMAKKKGLNVSVHAVSKSEVMEFADKIDVLLLGPHFSGEVLSIRRNSVLMALWFPLSIPNTMARWMRSTSWKMLSSFMGRGVHDERIRNS